MEENMQEAQAPLPAGTVIHERYMVESLFGKGDFGNVYLVRDQRDEQKLFVLAELISPTERERYRFTLDYVSLAPLDRRVLPRTQYVLSDDKSGRAYLLMGYIEESNLEMLRLQQAEKRFPLGQVITTMTPVINAVACLHARHPPVIHGNIQPASIIVSQMVGAPVLAMLEIFAEGSTTTPLHYFAPGYGATEQYSGEFSIHSDIYGSGATCYTLLTGIAPPDALYRSTQLSNGESDPLKPVHEVIPGIPRLIAEAIQRAMSINANDRFSSVEQLRDVLVSSASQSSLGLSPDMQSTPLPPPVPTPEQPATPQVWELIGLRPEVSEQADEELASAPAPEKTRIPRVRRTWKPGVFFIVLALLVSLGTGAGFWFHGRSLFPAQTTTPTPSVKRSSPTPTPGVTPVSSIYPTLTGTYTGTILDVSANVSTTMSLTGIRQTQANISGYLALGPAVQGSGPFKGTVDTTRHFQFIVTDTAGNARLSFQGIIQSATSLGGDYYSCSPAGRSQGNRCSHTPGSYGIWNVVLT
jgi:eukaryotic-like serine/threonine-protein kinase